MAKGQVWGMIAFFSAIGEDGTQPEIVPCPICGGPMARHTLTKQYKCKGKSTEDMPKWLENAIEAAGFRPWQYYTGDGAIETLATAANGAKLEPMKSGSLFGDWQWSKLSEGDVTWPEWFPQEDCKRYVEERWAQWETELAQILEQYPEYDGLESESHPVVRINAINAKKHRVSWSYFIKWHIAVSINGAKHSEAS